MSIDPTPVTRTVSPSGRRMRRTACLIAAAPLLTIAGCPAPAVVSGGPPLSDFTLPADVTAARVRSGQSIVYALPDQDASAYSFFLADADEPVAEHELIATVPAEDFGFAAGETLVAPVTISFADNLERGVVGFADGSFLLEADDLSTAQRFSSVRVTPLAVFGQPIFNPAISPLGDRLAFQNTAGQIGYRAVRHGRDSDESRIHRPRREPGLRLRRHARIRRPGVQPVLRE